MQLTALHRSGQALAAVAAALATLAGASPSAARASVSSPKLRAPASGVATTRSTSEPYYACGTGACEAIVAPQSLSMSSPLLEGGGEKGGFDPQDLRSAYGIPGTGGASQTIALVDAYGYAAAEADLAKYRERYGLPPCTKADGCFHKVNEKGEEGSYPGNEGTGWELETALDLDMASAACSACHILLVEATSEYAPDTAESVNTAARLGATEISNSYGYPEDYEPWCGTTACAQYSVDYDHPGVVITASAGDSGYDDQYWGLAAANFPAASPYVIAVGGTSLRRAANARGWSEEVWSEGGRRLGTGGGCSKVEAKPAWQLDPACAKRTDNDVAAVGACETPVSVYSAYFSGWENVCGTSASAPLVAGMAAHEGEAERGLGADVFYREPAALYDVTLGASGTCTPPAEDEYLCHAEIGYDGPTGLGSPQGAALPPSVTGVQPNEGPAAGGTHVTITGSNLAGATAVAFGAVPASAFSVESPGTIAAVAPAGAGTVDVAVTTPEGTSAVNPSDRFSYSYVYPELGRCVKVAKGTGSYGAATCLATKAGGSYEWLPGLVRAGFTAKGAKSKLETVARTKVLCAATAIAGGFAGARAASGVTLTLSGCEMPKQGACASSGQAAGTIVSAALEGALQWESRAARRVALDLFAATPGAAVASFQCGAVAVEVRGSVLAPVTVDKMGATIATKFAATYGVQKPTEYETANGRVLDVLEASLSAGPWQQAGLTVGEAKLTGEEAFEVNAVL